MADTIYVLSIPRISGEYKVGIHSGTVGQLYSRYSTSIHDVKIHLIIERVDARKIELRFQELRQRYRINKKHSGNPSEWFKMKLSTIVLDLIMIVMSGKKYGLDGQKKVVITELTERREMMVRIVRPRLESDRDSSETDSLSD